MTAWVGTGPSRSGSFSSRASRILARRTCCAGWDPVRASPVSICRSAALSRIGRDFVLAMTALVEVHGYAKQGAAFGYSGVRGLNAVLATVSTETVAPVIAAQRLRTGSAGSARGAARLATDPLALIGRTQLVGRNVLLRADSAFYSHAPVAAVLTAGADVSITVRMDPAVNRAIAGIGETAWTPIKYADAIFDETTGTWISRAQVAEVPFTAFTSRKKAEQITGRLIV